ncbi:MAG: IS66 family insertion sequence element accessory protein TnpB [Culicoidibacterales bacterium]
MLVNFSNAKHIFIVCGHTDMRRGIDGLANIITEQYNLDLFQEDAIFLLYKASEKLTLMHLN